MSISPEFVERYQIEYAKNPNSRIFAPLAEAYRQMGLLDEAFAVCSKGVQRHPEFAGGRVALAKIWIDRAEKSPDEASRRNAEEQALIHLQRAAEVSPDNLLAHSLMGELLLNMRRPKDALKALKMVLFLNPNDERALKAVRKWEFLSADDYDEELFEMTPVFRSEPIPKLEPLPSEKPLENDPAAAFGFSKMKSGIGWRSKEIERAVSLSDAFTVRGEMDRALNVLLKARDELGNDPDLDRRIKLLGRRSGAASERAVRETPMLTQKRKKLRRLQLFLQRINERRFEG